MYLVTLRHVTHAFGAEPLLDDVSLELQTAERVCLLGANGAGKTTLLGIVTGDVVPDAGEVSRDPAVCTGNLPQAVPAGLAGRVEGVVAGGLATLGRLLEEHRRLGDAAAAEAAPATLAALDQLHGHIESAGGWDPEARVRRILTRLGLDAGADFAALSGGLQRRVLLARALVAEPELLVLDEPTNHLDVETIEWLEGLMRGWRGGLLFTTHDRRLIERVATRILELERGRLTSWPGDYANYLRRREERLAAEALARARFERKLSEEEIWIRQGIRARRTRNEGRVRRLEEMRRRRRARRELGKSARFSVQDAESSGRRVVEARGVGFAYDGEPVVGDLDVLVERGDRVGVIGPNGSGKTTLLRLLLGELEPDSGEVIRGTRVETAYFDQLRAVLDPSATLADSVAEGADHVIVNGERRHVIGYLADFLFTAERARQRVAALSGGERARLLLARLFARPCNLLVMDEPTNDLDIETLELLEDRLMDYAGALLLVSHDRAFLDNVVTSTLVLEGGGRVGEYVGGYSDWLRQRPAPPPEPVPTRRHTDAGARGKARSAAPRRLGYREQRELATLPERIEALEHDIARAHARLADPELYRGEADAIVTAKRELGALQIELEAAYARWAELEAIAGGG
ncbi:MAG: ATP-binding cassette domain-containing protein [Gammaproteobacteria bacterium]|nr:ATP-binding cassette domain-containing protein [Gammaproteobacteria bacterium]